MRWRSALEQSASHHVRQAGAWLENLDRASWHLLLPASADATVLEIGAGLGTVTHALALAYRRVVALEPTVERVTFMRRRFAEEGLGNVHVVQGDPLELPVQRESADLVVLNGVLGWACCGGPLRRVRHRLLETVRTVIKPGGLVYLGAGNRWALHAGGLRRRASLASARGYRRLLEATGYTDVRIWCALPSHDEPRFLVAYEQPIFDHFLRSLAAPPRTPARRLVWRVFNSLGLLKGMTGSYCLVARRDGRA